MATTNYALNKTKYLVNFERQRLEEILKTHIAVDGRNCCLILLALYTGARATELLNLKWQDLDLSEKSLFIKGIKNSNDRDIPLPNWVFQALVKQREHSELIFPISYNRLRQVWQIYRPTIKKFHALRHTFAIGLYQKTKDIRLVQTALGHRNITNTMIYADYVYSQEELRKLIL